LSAALRPFPGFVAGSHATAIPNALFSELLPAIDDPVELVVSMYAFYALGRRTAAERWLTVERLAAERPLLRALQHLTPDPVRAIRDGLTAAVARGTLVADGSTEPARYVINSAAGRRSLGRPAGPEPGAVLTTAPEQAPTIYALYEESIGTMSPLVADELRAAEDEYPADWIEAAFREAALNNRRSWRYVARILERWRDEGRNDASSARNHGEGRDLAGRYRRLIRR